ncbi:hypothetical protein SMC26_32880 [Actinomadura fulvescens]|uniref:Uncharacterized protein n=1 Tax=Actinomadura fulvescens TaxID=46160 RepID=A0ABN3QBN7_9ACTN
MASERASARPPVTAGQTDIRATGTATETISLKDIQTARSACRRALHGQTNERIAVVSALLPDQARRQIPQPARPSRKRPLIGDDGPGRSPTPRTSRDRPEPATRDLRSGTFIATKEHRRFTEFAGAVRRNG